MSKTVAYIRASTDKEVIKTQRHEILKYRNRESVRTDDFIKIAISLHKSSRQRRIDELCETLKLEDILIDTEPSRLGRCTHEVIIPINQLIV